MSKELKFTKGYNQAELDAWWKMVGYPGEAPRIPDYLVGKTIGRGRDAYSVWDMSSGKLDKKSRMGWNDLDKTYGKGTAKAVNDFRNQLGKFSDPYREQSGISKVAGGVLDVATLAFPQLAAMRGVAEAGNAALKNPQQELADALEQNAATNNGSSSGTDVLGALSFNRERTPGPTNYLRYGMGPEYSFFKPKGGEDPNAVPVGVAPPPRVGLDEGGFLPGPLTVGSQNRPLDSFSVDGRTGNKTTNKDLPEWLRKLGMKGDAYAAGMLKPQIRYGMWYKNGKLNFADGTAYDAKKNKDGTYSYTGADGQPVVYDPTDEQDAYNKKYRAEKGNQSFLDKASNAVKFELDHGAQIVKGLWDQPEQLVFGIDPLGTKIGNAVTGAKNKPLVDQMGGALESRYGDYEARTGKSTGYAHGLQDVAHVVASMYGAKGLGKAAGAGAKALGATEAGSGALGQAANAGAKYVASNPKLVAGALRAANNAISNGDTPVTEGIAVGEPNGGGGGSQLDVSPLNRLRVQPGVGVRYGMGPEKSFYVPGKAEGGTLRMYPPRPKQKPAQELRNFANLPGQRSDPRIRVALGDEPPLRQFVSHGTGAGGREDNIDAKLSENEYVIDAETVSLLGDGSPEKGAAKLDAMRKQIRRHKGQALAKGAISPDAKPSPLQYLRDGGGVRPKQSLSQAMDVQDIEFDRLVALPRKQRGKGALSDYNQRMRARVGDTTYDLAPPQRVARNNRGGK